MSAVTYSEPRVIEYVTDQFVPWRVDFQVETRLIRLYDVSMTPTVIIADGKGKEHYRSVGFLPPRRFLGQLAIGLAWVAFGRRKYSNAGDLFEAVARDFPECGIAPEAIYFRGVSRDKITEDHSSRKAAAEELDQRCPDSDWAVRASLWLDD